MLDLLSIQYLINFIRVDTEMNDAFINEIKISFMALIKILLVIKIYN